MPGGCFRGGKCPLLHPAAEFVSLEMGHSFIPTQVGGSKSEIDDSSFLMTLQLQRVGTHDLGKIKFVRGLSPSVESDVMREFFEVDYGPVIIGSQAGDQLQSRGFGFVTFKHAASVSAAVEAHFINIYENKVEIKGAVPRFQSPVLEVSRVDLDTHSDATMTGKKILDLNEAWVLEVATPGSLCLPKNELPPCNQTSSPAKPQQTRSSESSTFCLSGISPTGVCNVSGDSNLHSSIREVPPESASPSFGCPSANIFSVSRDRSGSQSVIQYSARKEADVVKHLQGVAFKMLVESLYAIEGWRAVSTIFS